MMPSVRRLLIAAAVSLVGCAAPNSPGRGGGSDYTPLIDLSGVDRARYSEDLGACRQYAKAADANATADLIGGVIVGAALGAALTPRGYGLRGDMATYGGQVGGVSALAANVARAKHMMINCMAGRGYRTLEVTPLVIQQPALSQVALSGPPAINAPPPTVPSGTVHVTASASAPRQRELLGENTHQVERMPETRRCNAAAVAVLTGKNGSALETFSVQCTAGDILSVRCEFGVCHVLK